MFICDPNTNYILGLMHNHIINLTTLCYKLQCRGAKDSHAKIYIILIYHLNIRLN